MAEGKFDWQIPFAQWSTHSVVEVPLVLVKRFLTERFLRFQGPIRGTIWAFIRLESSPEGFSPEFSFSPDAKDESVKKAGPRTKGYFHFDVSEQPALLSSGCQITAFFQIRLEADGAIVARPEVSIAFQAPSATHVLSLDLGVTGARVALQELTRPDIPKLQTLNPDGPLEWQLPAQMELSKKKNDFHNSGEECQAGPIRLGALESDWYVDFSGSANGGGSPNALAVPPAAQVFWAPPEFWHHVGVSTRDLEPFSLIWIYVTYVMDRLFASQPDAWIGHDRPRPGQIMITLPGRWSRSNLALLKSTINHALQDCRDGASLVPGWRTTKPSIHVMHQADAAAADAIFRPQKLGGLGARPVGTREHILVFHMGASSCEATVLDYCQKEEGQSVFPHMEIQRRFHKAAGGNDIDRIFCRVLHQATNPQYDSEPLLAPYSNLMHLCQPGTPEFAAIHNTRVRQVHLARRIKEMLADACYGRPTTSRADLCLESKPQTTQRLLDELYDLVEGAPHKRVESLDAFRRASDALRLAIAETEIRLNPDPTRTEKSQIICLSSLLDLPAFDAFFQETCISFLEQVLKTIRLSETNTLHVVLSGGMMAFPLVQESILHTLAKNDLKFPIAFPNRNASPAILRQSVVSGGCQLATSLADPQNLVDRLNRDIALLSFDQRRGCPILKCLIPRHTKFKRRNQGPAMLSALATSVRFRQNAQAPEVMRIAAMDDPVNWDNPKQCDELARTLSDHGEKFFLLFDEIIEKTGQFTEDDDRAVHLNLSAEGQGAIRLFPKTQTQSDGTKSGSGTYQQFLLSRKNPTPSAVPTIAGFPF